MVAASVFFHSSLLLLKMMFFKVSRSSISSCVCPFTLVLATRYAALGSMMTPFSLNILESERRR